MQRQCQIFTNDFEGTIVGKCRTVSQCIVDKHCTILLDTDRQTWYNYVAREKKKPVPPTTRVRAAALENLFSEWSGQL